MLHALTIRCLTMHLSRKVGYPGPAGSPGIEHACKTAKTGSMGEEGDLKPHTFGVSRALAETQETLLVHRPS